ncbi:MAG TPA: hypothetical protein PLP27_03820 [Crocinitomicaceae bacterium]|nr:hypothetical protein [Crocinitomicaceae bacterium]
MIFWNINISSLIKDYLGRKFLRTKQYNWLMALLSPLQTSVNEYSTWRKERFYMINITGQVISLTGYLNDKFDFNQRRIHIVTAVEIFAGIWVGLESEVDMFVNVGLESEDNGIWLGTFIEQNLGDDFIVYIPADIASDVDNINRIKSAIYQVKLAGKKFSLEVI